MKKRKTSWLSDLKEKGYKYMIYFNGEVGASKAKMKKDGRCPFLNKDNLCDIIINYGYENISYICKNHPKFFNSYPYPNPKIFYKIKKLLHLQKIKYSSFLNYIIYIKGIFSKCLYKPEA